MRPLIASPAEASLLPEAAAAGGGPVNILSGASAADHTGRPRIARDCGWWTAYRSPRAAAGLRPWPWLGKLPGITADLAAVWQRLEMIAFCVPLSCQPAPLRVEGRVAECSGTWTACACGIELIHTAAPEVVIDSVSVCVLLGRWLVCANAPAYMHPYVRVWALLWHQGSACSLLLGEYALQGHRWHHPYTRLGNVWTVLPIDTGDRMEPRLRTASDSGWRHRMHAATRALCVGSGCRFTLATS